MDLGRFGCGSPGYIFCDMPSAFRLVGVLYSPVGLPLERWRGLFLDLMGSRGSAPAIGGNKKPPTSLFSYSHSERNLEGGSKVCALLSSSPNALLCLAWEGSVPRVSPFGSELAPLLQLVGNETTSAVGCCGFTGPNPSAALDKRTFGLLPRPSAVSDECRISRQLMSRASHQQQAINNKPQAKILAWFSSWSLVALNLLCLPANLLAVPPTPHP